MVSLCWSNFQRRQHILQISFAAQNGRRPLRGIAHSASAFEAFDAGIRRTRIMYPCSFQACETYQPVSTCDMQRLMQFRLGRHQLHIAPGRHAAVVRAGRLCASCSVGAFESNGLQLSCFDSACMHCNCTGGCSILCSQAHLVCMGLASTGACC